MKNTIFCLALSLSSVLPSKLYAQQQSSNLLANFSQKPENTDTMPLSDLIDSLIYHNTIMQAYDILTANHELQYLLGQKLLQMSSISKQETGASPILDYQQNKRKIYGEILLEHGLYVNFLPDSNTQQIVAAPVTKKTQTPLFDPYVQDIFHTSKSDELVNIYHISTDADFMATPFLSHIIVNEPNIKTKQDVMDIVRQKKITAHQYDFINAVYANEKLHLTMQKKYRPHIDQYQEITTKTGAYTFIEIEEFLSDVVSMQHDARYVSILMRNAIIGDFIDKPAGVHYQLSIDYTRSILQSQGYILQKQGDRYRVDKNTYIDNPSFDDLMDVHQFIIDHMEPATLTNIQQQYLDDGKLYVSDIDAVYKDIIQTNKPK